ncbi:sensor domain-containing diguanylate cyclase [Chitinibacter tainanensis]|uniref:sensor domain-containing diguanylate cyclase n=1 Tax=Chitinibacter tainanensis TaxID=230667 RepID=UPI00040B1916|nr:diguanylate cyclase [Chitinibacter tainanensis]
MQLSLSTILDALEAQIAVIDAAGRIVYVNAAWQLFGEENGMPAGYNWLGCNYLQVCQQSADPDATQAAALIMAMLQGQQESGEMEYPCHSPTVERWFMMQLSRSGDGQHVVISHHNITMRKRAEAAVEHLSLHDPLTGLGNRRLLTTELPRLWQQHARHHACMSLLLLDIDHFKQYNDHFGHQVGDQCLQAVAQVLRTYAQRADDVLIRYGGEEFLVLLGFTPAPTAIQIAQAIQTSLGHLPLRSPQGGPVTVSIGYACTQPNPWLQPEGMLAIADQHLYAAKLAGRNRVCGELAARPANLATPSSRIGKYPATYLQLITEK